MRKITHLWGCQELDVFLREFVQHGCPLIPVLLADAPQEPALPVFLRAMTWVDFRRHNPDPMRQLLYVLLKGYFHSGLSCCPCVYTRTSRKTVDLLVWMFLYKPQHMFLER